MYDCTNLQHVWELIDLQEAQSAVESIETYVNSLSRLSKTLYADTELNPELGRVVKASGETITIMGDLNNSLKCDQVFRWIFSLCDSDNVIESITRLRWYIWLISVWQGKNVDFYIL